MVAGAAILGSWAAIGFKDLLSYPDLLSMLTDIEGANSHSVSVYTAVLALGAPLQLRHFASVAAGCVLLGGVIFSARRGDDEAAFFLALLSALAFAPTVWLHYLALLVVPIAIYRPRFSGLWAAPYSSGSSPSRDGRSSHDGSWPQSSSPSSPCAPRSTAPLAVRLSGAGTHAAVRADA